MRKRLRLVASLVVIVALLVGGCFETPSEPLDKTPTTPTPELPTRPPPDLSDPDRFPPTVVELKGIPEKASYEVGDLVLIECTFTNIFTGPIVVRAFSEPVEINSMALRGSKAVRSLDNKMYEIKLGPGETKRCELTWDQKDDIGKQVAPGWYWVEVGYETWQDTSPPSGRYGIRGMVSEIMIKFPYDPMEKVIEVKQSVTITGLNLEWRGEILSTEITMTLERVELTWEGAKFSLLASSPHYLLGNPEDPWARMREPWDKRCNVQYCVDGVVKGVYHGSIGFPEEGVRFKWGFGHDKIAPVPRDAKELTFTVISWGYWEGPWEFHVSLE